MEHFHPQFRQLLRSFSAQAPTMLLQFKDPRGHAFATQRPVALDPTTQFNASVGRATDGHASYVVTAGAVAALTDAALSLSATDQFFAELPILGRVLQTRSNRDPHHFIDYTALSGSNGQSLPLIPLLELVDDAQRGHLGQVICDLAFRFLLLHEQMHYLRGHLHYLFGAETPGVYDEIPGGGVPTASAKDRRALEIDADGSAIAALLELYPENHHVVIGKQAWLADNEHKWIRLVAVASLLVTLLISLAEQARTHDNRERTHPTPQTRMLNLLALVSHHVLNRTGAVPSSPDPALINMFKDITAIALLLGISRPAQEAFVEWKSIAPESFRHPACVELRDLHQRFEQLLPSLR